MTSSVKLNYRIVGNGSPVIFVHGYPLSNRIWEKMETHLSRHCQLILPDLRGFGQSPATGGTYLMRTLAEDLILLIDDLGFQKAFFAGHSMGGYVCLALAHLYPERVAGLALIATQAAADNPEKRAGRHKMIDDVKLGGIEPAIQPMLDALTEKEKIKPDILSIMKTASREGIIGSLAGMAEREDAEQWLDEMKFPVAIIAGAKDKIISSESAEVLKRRLCNSTSIILRQAGHMPMMEEPGSTASGILWLIRQAEYNK